MTEDSPSSFAKRHPDHQASVSLYAHQFRQKNNPGRKKAACAAGFSGKRQPALTAQWYMALLSHSFFFPGSRGYPAEWNPCTSHVCTCHFLFPNQVSHDILIQDTESYPPFYIAIRRIQMNARKAVKARFMKEYARKDFLRITVRELCAASPAQPFIPASATRMK